MKQNLRENKNYSKTTQTGKWASQAAVSSY